MPGDLDMSKPDFALSALLEEKLLDFIITQANLQFITTRGAAYGGLTSARKELDRAEESFKRTLERTRDHLDAVWVGWEAKRAEVETDLDRKTEDLRLDLRRFRGEVDKAQSAYNALVANAERSFRDAAITANRAEVECGASIGHGEHLGDLEEDLDSSVCNVETQESTNNQISAVWNVCGQASFWGVKVQGSIRSNIYADANISECFELLTKEARKSTQQISGVVRAVVGGAGYLAVKVVVYTFRKAWKVVEQVSSTSFGAVNAIRTREVTTAAARVTSTRNNIYNLGVVGHALHMVQGGRKKAFGVTRFLLEKVGNFFGWAKVGQK